MNFLQHSLVFALRGYQRVISPALMGIFGPLSRCRFEPSCSEYAVQAVRAHGAFKGAMLAAWRVCRCNPWCGCGVDPVPREFQISKSKSKIGNVFRRSKCSCQESATRGVEPVSVDVSNRVLREQFEISNLKFEMHEMHEMRVARERG